MYPFFYGLGERFVCDMHTIREFRNLWLKMGALCRSTLIIEVQLPAGGRTH